MYLEHFELTEKPFQLTPDSNFLFLSKIHARAKAYMEYAVWNRDGFVVITGEIGSGKTTLINHLLSKISEDVLIAKVHQTQLDELQFFQAILAEFGMKLFNSGKVELLDALKGFLFEKHAQRKQIVLIIDEAQNLSPRVLEEVRLLTGLETEKEKILNLILVGQPELKETLDAPGMEQLAQRIRLRLHIKPLSETEMMEYIKHRLTIAGRQGKSLFPAATMPLIYRYTGGTPRLINALCDTSLIVAYVEGLHAITPEIIETAIEELNWMPYSERARNRLAVASASARLFKRSSARLVELSRSGAFDEYPLAKECTTIGRLPSNDVVVKNSMVSGHHAKIVSIYGRCFLEDLSSTNGTFVNAQRVRASVLQDGDVIAFAQCQFKFVSEVGLGLESSHARSQSNVEQTSVMALEKQSLDD
jgi:type II secretory pathway predicted ATPase ExeA